MPAPKQSLFNVKHVLQRAVIEHAHTFANDDLPLRRLLTQVGQNHYSMNIAALLCISRIFSLDRKKFGRYWITGGSGRELTNSLNQYVDEINRIAENLDDDFMKKTEACAALCLWAESKKITIGNQASAASKLMWFVRPSCWTMYDRFVSSALKARGENAVDKMKDAFSTLNELGFTQATTKIDEIFRRNGLMHLSSGRVIDKFLMQLGGYTNMPKRKAPKNVKASIDMIIKDKDAYHFLLKLKDFKFSRRKKAA